MNVFHFVEKLQRDDYRTLFLGHPVDQNFYAGITFFQKEKKIGINLSLPFADNL